MSSRVGVRVRLAVDGDVGYVIKTWRETYGRESPWSRKMPRQVYHPYHRKIIEGLVAHAHVVVACNEKDPTHLLGFMCGERVGGSLVIHFTSVRHDFRGFGIGKLLLEAFDYVKPEPIVASHWTFDCEGLQNSYRLVYNPYILFRQFREQIDGRRIHPEGEQRGGDRGPGRPDAIAPEAEEGPPKAGAAPEVPR